MDIPKRDFVISGRKATKWEIFWHYHGVKTLGMVIILEMALLYLVDKG